MVVLIMGNKWLERNVSSFTKTCIIDGTLTKSLEIVTQSVTVKYEASHIWQTVLVFNSIHKTNIVETITSEIGQAFVLKERVPFR